MKRGSLPGLAYAEQDAVFRTVGDTQYRYSLTRVWGNSSLTCWSADLWVMLNGSTAGKYDHDPTTRRVEAFSRAFGADGFEIGNLFGLVSTDKTAVPKHANPVGPENDEFLAALVARADRVIIAWGTYFHPLVHERALLVLRALRITAPRGELWCLGRNQDGSPRHPLYLPALTRLERFT